MRRPARVLSIAALLAVLCGGAAQAHKLKVFATGEGKAIAGYVYFPGGGRAKGVTVVALGPAGQKLGEATTNDQGEFTIEARFRCDHTLVAQTADGHKASYLVEAAELAGDLPALGAASPATATPSEPAPAEPPTLLPAGDAQIEALVERAVSKQVRPLREQLERYEEKVRLRDVIGGIGYIVGLAGLAFYFLGSSRRVAKDATHRSS